jgi:hypothetical protein
MFNRSGPHVSLDPVVLLLQGFVHQPVPFWMACCPQSGDGVFCIVMRRPGARPDYRYIRL